MYLVSALFLFALPHLIPEFPQSTAYPYLVMLFLPLGHIGMVRMCNIEYSFKRTFAKTSQSQRRPLLGSSLG